MSTPYYEARIQASRRDPRLSNRERAAERLYVSVKSLADYETGATVPPCDVVQQMREVYGAHDLVGAHIRNYCPLMTDYGSEEPSELAQAALGWAVAMWTPPSAKPCASRASCAAFSPWKPWAPIAAAA